MLDQINYALMDIGFIVPDLHVSFSYFSVFPFSRDIVNRYHRRWIMEVSKYFTYVRRCSVRTSSVTRELAGSEEK